MAHSAPIVFTIFFFVLLLLASEKGPTMVAEGLTCSLKSQRFRGTCLRSTNCAAICNSENYPGGHCQGFPGTCYCDTNCSSQGPPPPNQDDQPIPPPSQGDEPTPSPNLDGESTSPNTPKSSW